MALSLLISAWLVGLLGGVHCVTMCGGLVTAVAARDGSAQPLLRAREIARNQLFYHAGRVTTYALLGAAFGTAGHAALGTIDLIPLQRGLYVVANLFLLLLGIRLALGAVASEWLQRAGARAFAAALPRVGPLLRQRGTGGRLAFGLVWGLVPCGLVYSVLPLALFAGGAWQGGATMLALGLGTVPNLMAAVVLLDGAKRAFGRERLRYAASAVLVAFAIAGLWRVLLHPEGLAQGAFCLPA